MKILLIGDYSNLHTCLATELKRLGHSVDIMSDRGGFMQSHSDIFIERKPGFIGSVSYLFQLFNILPRLRGYDVVQLVNTNFLHLRPGKIKYFFDRIKDQNGKIFLTLAGNDYTFVKACADAKIFRFSEFKVGDRLSEFSLENPGRLYGWISEANRHWSDYLLSKIDGAMSVLPEYDMAYRPVLGDKLTFTNLPVDLTQLPFSQPQTEGPLKIFLGMKKGMETQKGTFRLLSIARELEREFPDKVKTIKVQDVSLAEYLYLMQDSHIVLDQLYSYSPATNALQAMALGKVAGSGAQPEYYEYIGNPEVRPVFSLSPFDTDIKDRLRKFILDRGQLAQIGREGRQLVETHNDVRIVAPRFLSAWEASLNS